MYYRISGPNDPYGHNQIQGLFDYYKTASQGLSDAYQSVLIMHPDQKKNGVTSEPFSIHPNAVDNWFDADYKSNDSFIKWIITAYKRLLKEPNLPQNVVGPHNQKPIVLDSKRPGTIKNGIISVYHLREWAKNPTEYANEIKTYPWTFANGYSIDLGQLDNTIGEQALALADYRQKHPPDTTVFEALKPVTDTLADIAPFVQLVLSFVPGIGTIASMAIGATAAALEGKSLDEILKASAMGAIPGGPIVAAAATAAVNLAKAVVKGENVLKATGNQLYTASLQYIQDPKLRATADKAIRAIASGKNVLSTAEKAALDVAVSQIPDSNAQALVREALSGHLNPKTTLAALVSSNLPTNTFSDSLIAASKNVLTNIQIPNSKDLLNNARDEIIAAASNFITDPNARKALADATSKALSSYSAIASAASRPSSSPLSGSGGGGPNTQYLATIQDPAAKKIFQTILSGKIDPQSIIAATDGKLIQVMVKSDLSSNVAKLLLADSAPSPQVNTKGAVLSSGIQSGTLRSPLANSQWLIAKGSFMQLPGKGNPTEQFQQEGSTQWLAGFWIQVS